MQCLMVVSVKDNVVGIQYSQGCQFRDSFLPCENSLQVLWIEL